MTASTSGADQSLGIVEQAGVVFARSCQLLSISVLTSKFQ